MNNVILSDNLCKQTKKPNLIVDRSFKIKSTYDTTIDKSHLKISNSQQQKYN